MCSLTCDANVFNDVNGSTNHESSDSDKAPDVNNASHMVEHVAPVYVIIIMCISTIFKNLIFGAMVMLPMGNITPWLHYPWVT